MASPPSAHQRGPAGRSDLIGQHRANHGSPSRASVRHFGVGRGVITGPVGGRGRVGLSGPARHRLAGQVDAKQPVAAGQPVAEAERSDSAAAREWAPSMWPRLFAVPARMADALRLPVISRGPLELLPPRPAAFAAASTVLGLRCRLGLCAGHVYSDRWARWCVNTAEVLAETTGRSPHDTEGPRCWAATGQAAKATRPTTAPNACRTEPPPPAGSGLDATSRPASPPTIKISRPAEAACLSARPVMTSHAPAIRKANVITHRSAAPSAARTLTVSATAL
jgi:hypothetical protein